VGDIVAAILHVTLDPALHGVFNAGYGHAITVLDLARTIIRLAGSSSPIVHLPERPGDVRHSLAAVDRLAATGFRPAGTLAEGLKETVEWYREEAEALQKLKS
jgi:UDP-glucose 4-epimerase